MPLVFETRNEHAVSVIYLDSFFIFVFFAVESMAKLSTLVLLAAAIVSAVPVAQDDGNTLPVSTPLNDSHSFTKTDGGEDAPVQDYCGTIPEKPTTAEHQTATATFSYSATHETLAPKVHWSVDTKPATNVIPTPPEKGSQLYYGVNGNYTLAHFHFRILAN